MNKTLIGVALLVTPFLFNHVDKFLPIVTEFEIFGRKFQILEGLTSEDIIWTVIQKFNLVILYIAIYILVPFNKRSKLSILFRVVLFLAIAYTLFLCVSVFNEFTTGMYKRMFKVTYLSLIIGFALVLYTISFLTKKSIERKKEEEKRRKEILDLKNEINTRVENLQNTSLDIASKIKSLETLPLFIRSYDNMEEWSSHAVRHAKKIYEKLDLQLKELEKTKIK
ncbi:hypothetical protein [uncultured Dokdonia sp.]|uniref:hypothetical protein n=1 Tax=uncultured Dokdonia sp. TaxID=575653 RepID=UPI00263217AD|nr:hypothetical protein [uncultured Dokdonia sp.]